MNNITRKRIVGTTLLLIGLSLVLSIIHLIAPLAARAAPGVLYAAPAAQGSGNCSSWGNVCTLQTALNQAASGDEIWVKAGVHYPTADPADRTATFALKSGVALYGGFAGTETSRDQRDWQTDLTILSGDIDHNDINADGNSIAETWSDIQGQNAYHVVSGGGADDTAVLDGFVVTAGQADGAAGGSNYGGGMYNSWSNPTLSNLVFSGNMALQLGGGVYNDYSRSSFSNVTFFGNRASFGGGIYNNYFSPTLTNVVFANNAATQRGGGMYNVGGSPSLTDVTFSANTALYGGGMYNDTGNPVLTDAVFYSNSAIGADGSVGADGGGHGGAGGNAYGGGVYNGSGNLAIENTLFDSNIARGGKGGTGDASTATYCYQGAWGSWYCTYGHPAGNGGVGGNGYGGAIYNASGSLTFTGVAFQDNRAEGGQGGLGGRGSPSYSGSGWYYSGYPGGNGGSGGPGYGGAVYSVSTLNLDHSDFLRNRGAGGGGGDGGGNTYGGPGNGGAGGHGYGGGVSSQGTLSLVNAKLLSNVGSGGNGGAGGSSYYATGAGGNAGNGYGGAMYFNGGSAVLANLALHGNTARRGAQGTGNPYGSPGVEFGGGIANASGSTTVINATIANNTGGWGGGVYNQAGTLTLKNTIVAHNSGYAGHLDCSGSIASVGYNLDSGSTCNLTQPGDLSNTDPLLIDPANGDLRLQPASPAIDAGNNAAVPFGILADLDDNPRFVDIPTIPNTGGGTPPIVDMGAYEAQFVDVALSKEAAPLIAAPGESITFTLDLSSSGSLPATDVTVADTLPAFLENVSFNSTLAVTDTGNLPPYLWLVQDLAPGQAGSITVSGVLSAPLAAGTYTNTASISADGDLLAGNNTATVTFTILNVAPLFTTTPLTTVIRGNLYHYAIAAEDDNGDALTFTAPIIPAWLTIEDHGDGTATLSGIPLTPGEYPVLLRVLDQAGAFAEQIFTITVGEYYTYLPLVIRNVP